MKKIIWLMTVTIAACTTSNDTQSDNRAETQPARVSSFTELCPFCDGKHEACNMLSEGGPMINRFQDTCLRFTNYFGGTFLKQTILDMLNDNNEQGIIFHLGYNPVDSNAFIFIKSNLDTCRNATPDITGNYAIVNRRNRIHTLVGDDEQRGEMLTLSSYDSLAPDSMISDTYARDRHQDFINHYPNYNECYAGLYDKAAIKDSIFSNPECEGLRYFISLAKYNSQKFTKNHLRVILVGVNRAGYTVGKWMERSHPPIIVN